MAGGELPLGIAALVLVAALPEARRGWKWSIVPVAVAYAATLIFFVLANRLTTSANAIFLQSTAPLYLLLLGPLVLREPIRRSDLLFMTAVLVGIGLFFVGAETPLATAPNPRRGNIFGLASGLTYALMLAGLRRLARSGRGDAALPPQQTKNRFAGDPALAATTLGNVLACLVVLPMALPVDGGGAKDVAALVYLGAVQIGLAYVCLTRAIRYVPGVEATTLLMVEPVMNPVWAWLVHGERPGPWALAGGATIVAGTLVNTWRQGRRTQ